MSAPRSLEQGAQDAAVAACLLLAVAADGKGAVLREGGQQIQGAAGGGLGHFLAEFAHELLPELVCLGLLAVVLQPVRFERGVHGVGLGREFGVPDVVVVAAGEFGLGHTARRAAHGAYAQAFIGVAGAA